MTTGDCERMRREAKDDFRHDKPGIERRADCERPVKTGRRCLVVMVFAAAVIVPCRQKSHCNLVLELLRHVMYWY